MSRAALAIGALMLSLVAGCGSPRRGSPIEEPIRFSSEATRGRYLFGEYCYQCHPGGEGGVGPAINNKPLPAWLMRFQARHGLGAMPAFPPEQISDEDLRAIAGYLRELRTRGGRSDAKEEYSPSPDLSISSNDPLR